MSQRQSSQAIVRLIHFDLSIDLRVDDLGEVAFMVPCRLRKYAPASAIVPSSIDDAMEHDKGYKRSMADQCCRCSLRGIKLLACSKCGLHPYCSKVCAPHSVIIMCA